MPQVRILSLGPQKSETVNTIGFGLLFFSIEKALENKGFWQQGVQIDLLAARIFCFPGKIIYFYDFQMNPLTRNSLIVRGKS